MKRVTRALNDSALNENVLTHLFWWSVTVYSGFLAGVLLGVLVHVNILASSSGGVAGGVEASGGAVFAVFVCAGLVMVPVVVSSRSTVPVSWRIVGVMIGVLAGVTVFGVGVSSMVAVFAVFTSVVGVFGVVVSVQRFLFR